MKIELQLKGSLIEMGTGGKWWVKGKVSDVEVNGPKVRVASAN